jgi:hypothetical protein
VIPFAEASYVWAKLVEARLARESPDAQLRLGPELRLAAEQLAEWRTADPVVLLTEMEYLRHEGRVEDLLEISRDRLTQDGHSNVYRLATLFRVRGEDKAEFEHTHSLLPPRLRRRAYAMMAFFRMSEPHADRHRIAQDFVERQKMAALDEGDVFACWDIWALELLGERVKARELGKEYYNQMKEMKYFERWASLGEFLSGRIDSAALQEQCGTSGKGRQFANFAIAVRLLAEDDRSGAERHFRETINTNGTYFYTHWWAEAFLQRLSDPDWLPWLRNQSAASDETVVNH